MFRSLLFTLLILLSSLAQAANDLFQPVDGAEVGGPSAPATLRTRVVVVDPNAIAAVQSDGAELRLNLFDDVVVEALLSRRLPHAADRFSWVGMERGGIPGDVVLVVNGDQVTGSIHSAGQLYRIQPRGDGTHLISQLDEDLLQEHPPGWETLLAQVRAEADAAWSAKGGSADLPTAGDDGSLVDVMVLYTNGAASAYGGNMADFIQLGITETNTSYTNSGISFQVRLVHAEQVSYSEQSGSTGWSNMLGELRTGGESGSGNLAVTQGLRDQYGADLVSLWINEPTYCGLAYVLTSLTSRPDLGYSVVHYSCATGYYSFGHEMGHNMGARHDWYVDGTDNSPFTYNHGYTYPTGHWRTVMAYNNACSAAGTSCTRIPYWSSPNVNYGGVPTGVAEGQPQAADNHLALNNTVSLIANYRQTVSSCNGTDVVIADTTYGNGTTTTCTGSGSITTSGSVVVQSGADVTFTAPTVHLQSGFSAAEGSTFHAATP